jgi:hypothetical protein
MRFLLELRAEAQGQASTPELQWKRRAISSTTAMTPIFRCERVRASLVRWRQDQDCLCRRDPEQARVGAEGLIAESQDAGLVCAYQSSCSAFASQMASSKGLSLRTAVFWDLQAAMDNGRRSGPFRSIGLAFEFGG